MVIVHYLLVNGKARLWKGGGRAGITHLDDLVGGEGLPGHVILIEHHIDTGRGYEYGQVHFNGFTQPHFVGADASIQFYIFGL